MVVVVVVVVVLVGNPPDSAATPEEKVFVAEPEGDEWAGRMRRDASRRHTSGGGVSAARERAWGTDVQRVTW